MKLRPLQDRLVVKRLAEEDMTRGGIIIPDSAKEKPIEGEVIAVGAGKVFDDGQQLIESERLAQHVLDPRLARFDDRMSRIVTIAGHQSHRHGVEQPLQFAEQLVARHIRKADIGDDHVVMLIPTVSDH